MRAVPEDAIAGRAQSKAFLRQVNVRWHSVKNRFFADRCQHNVAFEAPREDLEIRQMEFANDLVELLYVVVVLNQDEPHRRPPSGQAGIACEDNTVFRARDTDDFVIFTGIRIRYVDAQNPQPARELADHHIGDELRFVGTHIRRGI